MDIRKIRKLIELLEETGISEIEIKEGEESLRLSRHSNVPCEAPQIHYVICSSAAHATTSCSIHNCTASAMKVNRVPTIASGHKIRSPMVGTMYTSPSPETPPFVNIGPISQSR